MTFMAKCPVCPKTFSSEGAWRAHLAAELAIEEGCATVRDVRSMRGGAANKIRKALKSPPSVPLPLFKADPEGPFGDWT